MGGDITNAQFVFKETLCNTVDYTVLISQIKDTNIYLENVIASSDNTC